MRTRYLKPPLVNYPHHFMSSMFPNEFFSSSLVERWLHTVFTPCKGVVAHFFHCFFMRVVLQGAVEQRKVQLISCSGSGYQDLPGAFFTQSLKLCTVETQRGQSNVQLSNQSANIAVSPPSSPLGTFYKKPNLLRNVRSDVERGETAVFPGC